MTVRPKYYTVINLIRILQSNERPYCTYNDKYKNIYQLPLMKPLFD